MRLTEVCRWDQVLLTLLFLLLADDFSYHVESAGCGRGGSRWNVVTQAHVEGRERDTGSLISPNLTGSLSRTGQAFTYNLSCAEAYCYVRVVFDHVYLPDYSVLKVYDGGDPTEMATVYRDREQPFFQSSRSSLYIVLKIYPRPTSNQRTLWPIFRCQYTFVTEDRLSWSRTTLPSQSFCGTRTPDLTVRPVSVSPMYRDNHWVYHDCYWTVQTPSPSYVVITLQSLTANVKVSNVSQETQNEIVAMRPRNTELDAKGNQRVATYWGKDLYVRLTGVLQESDYFTMSYGLSQNASQHVADTDSRLCAYKTCSTGLCLLYWEPCQDKYPFTDSSCDVNSVKPGVSRCGFSCYEQRDVCDGFPDCENLLDENPVLVESKTSDLKAPAPLISSTTPPSTEDSGSKRLLIVVVVFMAIVLVSVFVFWFGRRGFQYCCQLTRDCICSCVDEEEGCPCCSYPYYCLHWFFVSIGHCLTRLFRYCKRWCCKRAYYDDDDDDDGDSYVSFNQDMGIPPPSYGDVVPEVTVAPTAPPIEDTSPSAPPSEEVSPTAPSIRDVDDADLPDYHEYLRDNNSLPSYNDVVGVRPAVEEEPQAPPTYDSVWE